MDTSLGQDNAPKEVEPWDEQALALGAWREPGGRTERLQSRGADVGPVGAKWKPSCGWCAVPPELEAVWSRLRDTGVEVELYERGQESGKEQGIPLDNYYESITFMEGGRRARPLTLTRRPTAQPADSSRDAC